MVGPTGMFDDQNPLFMPLLLFFRCQLPVQYHPVFLITTLNNKAVLEPRVSPAFAITHFCNHCNISPTPIVIPVHQSRPYVDTVSIFQKLNQKLNNPKMTFDPISVEITCVTLPKDHCIQVP